METIKAHIRAHNDRFKIKCTYCNQRFVNNRNMKKHIQSSHPADDEKLRLLNFKPVWNRWRFQTDVIELLSKRVRHPWSIILKTCMSPVLPQYRNKLQDQIKPCKTWYSRRVFYFIRSKQFETHLSLLIESCLGLIQNFYPLEFWRS